MDLQDPNTLVIERAERAWPKRPIDAVRKAIDSLKLAGSGSRTTPQLDSAAMNVRARLTQFCNSIESLMERELGGINLPGLQRAEYLSGLRKATTELRRKLPSIFGSSAPGNDGHRLLLSAEVYAKLPRIPLKEDLLEALAVKPGTKQFNTLSASGGSFRVEISSIRQHLKYIDPANGVGAVNNSVFRTEETGLKLIGPGVVKGGKRTHYELVSLDTAKTVQWAQGKNLQWLVDLLNAHAGADISTLESDHHQRV